MNRTNQREVGIEQLEDRVAPATIVHIGAALFISEQSGILNVATTATPGQVQVTDTTGTQTFDGIVSKIMITGKSTGSAINDTIGFTANANPFQGTLVINSGNGDDIVNLSGTINKSATINTGLGNDSVVFTGTAVNVGKAFKLTDPGGTTMAFDMNDRSLTVNDTLTLSGLTTFDAGAGTLLKVAKSIALSAAPLSGTGLTATFSGASVVVGGGLTVTGGFANDVVSITSQFSLGGSFTVKTGLGDNTFVLTPAAGGTGIGGGFSYAGLDGVDVIVMGANSLIKGKTTANLGNGTNTFVDAATSKFQKDLVIIGGFNTNTTVITGQITGAISVSLAAGGSGNTTVVTSVIAAGKKFNYASGANQLLETLTLAPSAAATVNAHIAFGKGNSTFSLGPNLTLNGVVIGKGGTHTFNPGTAILLPTLKFINYP